MSFLIVLIAYLLSRYTDLARWLQRDRWFNQGIEHLAARYLASALPFFLLVVGVSLLTGALIRILPFGTGFLASVAVLLYSLGRHQWRDYITRTTEDLRTGRAETVWLSLESEGYINTGSTDALWMAIRKHAAYNSLSDLFTVFFWFCFAGSAGAVFSCLLHLYNAHNTVRNSRIPAFTQWQYALEWLPARYMALCFCLAGNFNSCFSVWRQLAIDTQLDTREFLCRCLDAALIVEDTPASDIARSEEQEMVAQSLHYGNSLQDLLKRTEMIGLVGLALTVLLVS